MGGTLQGEMIYNEYATIDTWLYRWWNRELADAAAASGLPPTDETVMIDFVKNWDDVWHVGPLMLRQLVILGLEAKQVRDRQADLLLGILQELKVLNQAQGNYAKVL